MPVSGEAGLSLGKYSVLSVSSRTCLDGRAFPSSSLLLPRLLSVSPMMRLPHSKKMAQAQVCIALL